MIELSVVNDEGGITPVNPTVIKIIGCGGGGSSAVNRMIEAGVSDVEFTVLNTDLQALNISRAQKRLAIGQKLTGGLGAGGNPSVGENAAKEDTEMISDIVKGADMVIITAGMGGGTGTGSAPVVANIAREAGALTIAVVTTPFNFEGPVRMKYAQDGLAKLHENVDSLIVIPNQQVMKIVNKNINYRQAFKIADDVLCQGVQGISEIITKPGVVNIDFADVKTVMKGQGEAILGVGTGEGENRAVDAAQDAISNPMLENRQIDGATKILVNITSSDDLSMNEIEEIVNNIRASADPNVEIFWGQNLDPEMGDKISVTVIATGFKNEDDDEPPVTTNEVPQVKDENVIDYRDFNEVLRGKNYFDGPARPESTSSFESVSTDDNNVGKLSTIGTLKDILHKDVIYSDEEDVKNSLSDGEVGQPSAKAQHSMEPPAGLKVKQDDLSQPAFWRNKARNGLSRSINLADDN